MALPKAIQAQVAEAEALLADMNKPQEAAVEAVNQPTDTPQAEPQPQAVTPPAPQAQPADNWEHKYKTLQGKYNSDVPRLQAEVNELKAQLAQAVARINEVAKPAAPKEEPQPVADPKDVEAFGEDLVDMVRRVAERMLGGVAKKLEAQAAAFEQRLTTIEQQLKGTTQTVAVTAEQAFFDRLTKLVPNWEEVNANQAFLDWLGEIDPVYGQPRQAALNVAQQTLNADRAAAVFKAWLSLQPQAPKADPVGKQVSPKASAASTPPTPNGKPVVTQKQIQEFYNDVARGKYRGREQEAQRLEAAINAAIAEGRVR